MKRSTIANLLSWTAIAAFAQTTTPPPSAFDVVSIRAVPPNAPPTMREIGFSPVLPGGQFVDSRQATE